MRAQGWTVLVAVGLAACSGCSRQNGSSPAASAGAVAVIDLDEIASRIGSDKQIASAINERQTALSQQLVDLAKSYNAQIAEQKAKLEAAEPQQSQIQVASWEQQANASLNKVKQQAAANLQSHRLQLVAQFRDQIKPIARRVAQERGLSVIVTKNDSVVFDYTAAADITDAVVDELLASLPMPPRLAANGEGAAQPPESQASAATTSHQ